MMSGPGGIMEKPVGVNDVGNYRFFLFSSAPKTVELSSSILSTAKKGTSSCNREPKNKYANIMWDPRVCRGAYIVKTKCANKDVCYLPEKRKHLSSRPSSIKPDGLPSVISKGTFKEHKPKKSIRQSYSYIDDDDRPLTPPPVDGRHNIDCQTEEYLEYLEDDDGPGREQSVQTENVHDMPCAFKMEKCPPNGQLVPSLLCKTSDEKGTQCFVWDIIDLDTSVRPVSENLAEAVISTALKECMEEFELDSLQAQRRRHMQYIHYEEAKIHYLKERIIQAEEQGEINKEEERFIRENEAQFLLGAIKFSSSFMNNFVEKNKKIVEDSLVDMQGRDPIKYKFGKWLDDNAVEKLEDRYEVSRRLLDDIIQRAISCDYNSITACQPRNLVPSNSLASFKDLMEIAAIMSMGLEYRGEFYGEFEDDSEEQKDSRSKTQVIWNANNEIDMEQSENSLGYSEDTSSFLPSDAEEPKNHRHTY